MNQCECPECGKVACIDWGTIGFLSEEIKFYGAWRSEEFEKVKIIGEEAIAKPLNYWRHKTKIWPIGYRIYKEERGALCVPLVILDEGGECPVDSLIDHYFGDRLKPGEKRY